MDLKRTAKAIPATIGVVWCIIVLVSYYGVNAAYYVEKISVFGDFFLRLLG